MTKGQAARALANAIVELMDDDVQLRNLLSEINLQKTQMNPLTNLPTKCN